MTTRQGRCRAHPVRPRVGPSGEPIDFSSNNLETSQRAGESAQQ